MNDSSEKVVGGFVFFGFGDRGVGVGVDTIGLGVLLFRAVLLRDLEGVIIKYPKINSSSADEA